MRILQQPLRRLSETDRRVLAIYGRNKLTDFEATGENDPNASKPPEGKVNGERSTQSAERIAQSEKPSC